MLAKNPQKLQTFSLAYGRTHVFYPVATPQCCTAALLLEIDPVGFVVHERRDRPGVGLGAERREPRASGAGRNAHPARSAARGRTCRGGESFLRGLFEPLDYRVEATRLALDPAFPDWGDSPFFRLTLATRARLKDVLSHLHVLLPVLHDGEHQLGRRR